MTTDYTVSVLTQPKYGWKVKLTGNTYYMVEEGKQPNAFHRKMQELFFGIKWEKVNDQR